MTVADSFKREEFRAYLMTFLNIPYRWGGANPLQGLDCGGFVQLGLDYLLIDPPGDQTADGLLRHFVPRSDQVQTADLGTLLFFGDLGRAPPRATHVAIALDRLRVIEAGGGDSSTLTLERAAAQGAYVKVSRIARRRDLICMLRPHALPWALDEAIAALTGRPPDPIR